MLPAEFERFHALMQGMAKLYERDVDSVLLDAYWLALRAWPLADFESAAAHLMQTCKFMPRPADFTELRKAGRATVGEAWELARASAGSCYHAGNYGSGGSSGDDGVDRVVRMIGGYRAIAMCDPDKLHFLERRFAEHYETQQDAQDVREAVPQIATTPKLGGPKLAIDWMREK